MILVESETWALFVTIPELSLTNAVSLSPAFQRQVERMNNDDEERRWIMFPNWLNKDEVIN